MAFSPANFIHGTSIRFHYRLFLIPWLKSKGSTSCSAPGRDYSSSLPVKYTPKKSLKNAEKEVNSSSVKEWGERHNVPELNVPRVDVPESSRSSSCDMESKNHDASQFSNNENGLNLGRDVKEKIDEELATMNDESTEKPEKVVGYNGKSYSGFQPAHSQQDVEMLAIELLASRAFTALELKKKLQGKKCPADIVDAVVTDFQSRGLINDSLYAEAYSRSRWSSSSWGPWRIRHGLSKKGVRGADADKAIKQVFENDEESGSQDPEIGMSKPSMDQLYIKAAKQWQQSHGVPHETRKSRIVRWLQYRGFNWSVIKYVLKKLESEMP